MFLVIPTETVVLFARVETTLDAVVARRASVDEGDLSGEVPAENTVFR
jgi:hypothetical protein